MKTTLRLFAIFFLVCIAYSCSQKKSVRKEQSAEMLEMSPASPAPVAEHEEELPARQFIRTADLRFRVHNVAKATTAIENAVTAAGGFVTKTELSSNVENNTVVQSSADSACRTIEYTVTNTMVLRVPNELLDTTLRTLAGLSEFLDSRSVLADDAALQLLANKMQRERSSAGAGRIENKMDENGSKLKDIVQSQDAADQRNEQADKARIASLSLRDKINFSTVTLAIYQEKSILKQVLPVNIPVKPYRAGFGTQVVSAMETGWYMLEDILVFLARMWGLLLLAVICWVVYRILRSEKFRLPGSMSS